MPKDHGLTDRDPFILDSAKGSTRPDNFDAMVRMEMDQSLSKSDPSPELRDRILDQARLSERTPLHPSELSA
jgi:hypothetical protein